MKYAILLTASIVLFSFQLKEDPKTGYTYEKDIKPFIQANCGVCHFGIACYRPSGSYLMSYDSLKARVNDGKLYKHVIVDKDMPPGGMWSYTPGLPAEQLNMLDSWIRAGAPKE
jgi:hypothetical protein